MMWSARLNPALQKEPWLITRWADGAQRMSQPQCANVNENNRAFNDSAVTSSYALFILKPK